MLLLSKFSESNTNVGSAPVNQGMQNTQSASALLQMYTNTVLQTPDIHLPQSVDTDSQSTVSEDLPLHQQTARDNANHYLSEVNPLLVGTLSDIIGFHNLWSAEFNRLMELAVNIDTGDNAHVFTEGINNLIRKTQRCSNNTQPVISSLNDFLPLVETDERNFSTDLQHVTVALEGSHGQIAQLKAQLEALHTAIARDTEIIAGGAAGEIVGVLMITVGALAEFETGGVSTALIVGGLAVMGGSSAAIGTAAHDLAEKQAEYKRVAAELSNDEQVYTLTKQASHHITSLRDATHNGIVAVESLQHGWDSLRSDFGQVVDALQNADPDLGSWLVDTLNSANSDWNDTYHLALHLQANGVLPVTHKNPGTSFVVEVA